MTNILITNDTRPDSPHRPLLDLIPAGKENAILPNDLAWRMGISVKELPRLIEDARLDGNYIAETGRGYFKPDTVEDLEEYVNKSQSLILASLEILNPLYYLLRGEKLVLIHEKVENNDD